MALSLVVVAAAAVALVIILHTNAGPLGSFEFGARYFARLGGIIFGPAILAWTIWWRVRGLAWTRAALALMSCAALLALFIAIYMNFHFRPLINPEPYDRAIQAATQELKSNTAMLGEDRVRRLRSLKPRIQAANGNTAELLAVIQDCDELKSHLEGEVGRVLHWPDFVRRTFREAGVSEPRTEEYLRQVTPSLDLESFARADDEIIQSLRTVQAQAKNAMSKSP